MNKGIFAPLAIAGLAMCWAVLAVAEEVTEAEEKPWSGEAVFGLVAVRGNSDTTNMNGRIEAAYKIGRWTHSGYAAAIKSEDDGSTTAERYRFGYKADWALNERSYLFGRGDYDKDKFSGFDHVITLAAGYGHHLIKTDKHKLSVEIGPGYRMETKEDDTDNNEPILNLSGDYTWTLSETSKFTQEVISRAGSDNTSVESVTALESRIIGELAMRAAYRVIYNSETPPDTESTDRFTTIGLAYKF